MDELTELLARADTERYGEDVTMGEHLRLTAMAAQRCGATDALIVACLLHDIGHFLAPPDDAYGHHDHGETAAAYLADRFAPAVSEPVRLHIEAKRYLCGIDPGYHDRLSRASQHTLTKQGGPMDAAEAAAFAASEWAADAVALRRWEDDHGKQTGEAVPPWSAFMGLIEDQLLPSAP